MSHSTPLEKELAGLIVRTLNLDHITADVIDPEAPLFGAGLNLDSIDALEIAMAVSKVYGVKLRADDKNNQEIFSSIRALARYVEQHRQS